MIKAINNLDLKQLSLENVELLQKMIPTEQEQKAYKEYVIEKKDLSLLTEEDKFMLQLTKIERISSKLSIMSYIGNFFDCLHLISPVSVKNINISSFCSFAYLFCRKKNFVENIFYTFFNFKMIFSTKTRFLLHLT